ncbi:MAG: fibronectin type III domain-containing protein [Blastocatellia bacterium]
MKLKLCFLICAVLSLSACGKVGAPVPPARITVRTSDLSAIQRGGQIVLSWPAPPLGADEDSRSYIAQAVVYRLDEQRDQEPVLDPDDYEDLARVIGYLARATIEAQVKQLGHLEFNDAVNLGDQRVLANRRLRYAVRYLNKRDQPSVFSNTVALEPSPGIALPPGGLKITDQKQDQVTLSWNVPETNVDGSQPASVVGYNIYRRNAKRNSAGRPLNAEPLADTSFIDSKFQYQVDYVYIVRALSQGANGLIESADGEAFAFTPVDTFKPSPPEPVTLASSNGTISLFWPSNPERDVVGYNVYRANAASAPDTEWLKLTPQPITTVTYRDDRVTIDQVYYYRVSAVDRFDNESERSPVVSETAHP